MTQTIFHSTGKKAIRLATIVLLSAWCFVAQAQTPGLIIRPSSSTAGQQVLDPNNDGYTSATTGGYTTDDVSQSEVAFKSVPQIELEPNGDLLRGPTCGFTDFTDNGSKDAVSMRLDTNNNLIFRFRMSGYQPNSKGYSLLIDTDSKFGRSGPYADPNAVTGNPGFEMEIVFRKNFYVELLDCDGSASGTSKLQLNGDDYSQISVAYNTNCTKAYFYDFYIPFSQITTYFPSITTSTPMRFAINTVMAPHSALKGPISDVAGMNDATYGGNLETMWTQLVENAQPTSVSAINSGISVRTAYPVVNSPIGTGATAVSGTSSEANGTVITVYKNGTSIGTTTVSGGTWTLSGISALATNDVIKATATATGKSLSADSRSVTVTSCSGSSSVNAAITCTGARGIAGTVGAAVPIGTVIKIYNTGGLITSITTTTAGSSGNQYDFFYSCNGNTNSCQSGGNCTTPLSGVYWITLTESGKCESGAIAYTSISCGTTTATPVISGPVSTASTSISGTTTTASNTVYLFINGVQTGTTTSGASSPFSWTITGQTFKSADVVTVRAKDGSNCLSAAATAPANPPIVTSPLKAGVTVVSGTSVEAAGTTITLYKNGTSIGTTTVDANGNWTKTGLTALVANDLIKATATPTNKGASGFSNTVTVLPAATTITPTITGSYTEGATTVSGTLSASMTGKVYLYLDGSLIDSVSVTASSSWSITSLSSTYGNDKYLYAGGTIYATAKPTTASEGASSNTVVVSCQLPTTNNAVTANTSEVCYNTTGSVNVSNSQQNVIYTLRNNANTADLGPSALGNGGTLTLVTYALTANQTVKVNALKISSVSCSVTLTNTADIVVNAEPTKSLTVSAASSTLCSGSSTNINVQNSQNGFTYQLRNNANNANIGSAVTGNGGTISLPTSSLTSTTTFNVQATDITKSTNCQSTLTTTPTVTVNANPTTSNAGSNQTVCGTSTTLAANTPGTGAGVWSVVSGAATFTSASSPTTAVTSLGYGANVLRWTISNSPCTASTSDVTITRNCAAQYTVESTKPSNSHYTNGERLASVSDADGAITNAVLSSGSLPPGTALNSSTGEITVADKNYLQNGTYNFYITTTDAQGGVTDQLVTISFLNPLPVEFISFNAKLESNKVELTWSTATETNNDYFSVERSADGVTYSKIATVKGAGNSVQIRHYASTDFAPLAGVSYYRVKQTDFNGAFDYTHAVAVRNILSAYVGVNIFPNPVDKENVTLQVSGLKNSRAQLYIYNMTGAVVYTQPIVSQDDKTNISLNGKLMVPTGMYIVKLVTEGIVTEQKIFIQ